ncbi:MAG: peptidase C15, partial [Starkeya sp.]|nr:peptidase C15 [Starkeya sp.]
MRAGPAKAPARPRLLITGFGHFPGMPANPSAQLARRLARSRPAAGAATEERLLATRWDEAAGFPALLAQTQPDIVLMLGVAARRRRVSIEIVGRKATGAFPDAAGCRPASRVLEPGAPAQR